MSSELTGEVPPMEGPFFGQTTLKYKGNGHNFTPNFFLAITSCREHIFYFLFILRSFWPKSGPSIGGTSHVRSELILTFLESGEQGEWD